VAYRLYFICMETPLTHGTCEELTNAIVNKRNMGEWLTNDRVTNLSDMKQKKVEEKTV